MVAVDGDPDAVAFPFADVALKIDFADVDRVTAEASRLGVEGVLAISTDRAVPPAAEISARLGLPGIGIDVARAMTDKALMRGLLELAGVPQPGHAVLTSESDLQVAAKVSLPAVLKPVDSGGQRGIYLIDSLEQLPALLPDALAFSRSGRAMLEEYVDGIELNGLLVARGGEPTPLTLSDRLRPEGRGFGVGWIHSFPSSLPAGVLAEAESVAVATVRALGLRDGIAFPQLIADKNGVVRVVEIAARIPAGQMADLVSFGTGINLFAIAIEQALGHTVPDALVTPTSRRPVAIRFLTASPGVLPLGTVSSIDGLDAVRSSRGVLAAGLYFEPGTTIGPLQVDADRRGYIVATAGTPARALELADKASKKLVVRTAEASLVVAPGRGRLQPRRLVPILAGLVLVASVASALVVTRPAQVQRALLLGARVDRTFSPICDCPTRVAHLSFRLLRAGRLTVQVVNAFGRPVATFLRDRTVFAGWKHFAWNGLTHTGRVLPNGLYLPQVTFVSLHRTLRLPSPIRLDTQRPRLLRFTAHGAGAGIAVRYAFDRPVRVVLLVDGRRAVVTRSTAATGRLSWGGRFADGQRIAPSDHRVSLIGIDAAGNRSPTPRAEVVHLQPAG